MRRRRQPPDTRLDWRDPEMPCFELSQSRGMVMLTPKEKQRIAQRRFEFQCEIAHTMPKGPDRRNRG